MAIKYMDINDPDWVKHLNEEREKLWKEYGSSQRMVRICARCGHPISVLHSGSHGAEEIKCPTCKFENFFTPVQFRKAW